MTSDSNTCDSTVANVEDSSLRDKYLRECLEPGPDSPSSLIVADGADDGPGSCVVLAERFCDRGEPVFRGDGSFFGLGFNLPPGTEVYAPFYGPVDQNYEYFSSRGRLYVAQQKPIGGYGYNDPRIRLIIIGSVTNLRAVFGVMKGEVLAEVVSSDGWVYEDENGNLYVPLGGYNLVISFQFLDPVGGLYYEPDQDFLWSVVRVCEEASKSWSGVLQAAKFGLCMQVVRNGGTPPLP